MASSDGAQGTAQIVFFDGVCLFCRRWVRFVIRRDRARIYGFAWLQSVAAARHLGPHGNQRLDTVVLLRGRHRYRKSGAVLRIIAGLGGPWRLATLLLVVPAFVRDACYDLVGGNRYRWFGRTAACELPPADLASRFVPDGDILAETSQAESK